MANSRKLATPKAAAAAQQLPLPVPLPAAAAPVAATGRRVATPKPLQPVNVEGAYRGEPLALFELGEMVRRWSCVECCGIIREDGLAIHHYACSYWLDNPTETPF